MCKNFKREGVLKSQTFITFTFKSLTKVCFLNIITFMNFVFISSIFHFNFSSNIKMMFRRVMLDRIKVWSLVGVYKSKIHKNCYI